MRERLWSQRMLALYRSGRQAEALRVFQDLRSFLVAELGIEPGHDVTWMERAILAQDPALDFLVRPGEDTSPALALGQPAVPAPQAYRRGCPCPGGKGGSSAGTGRKALSATGGRRWATARGGCCSLTAIPVSGRRRLVAELARRVEGRGGLVLWGRCDEDPVAPFQPFAEALGRYFQSLSADRISRMPDWQLSELSRLVLRLREYAPPLEDEGGDPDGERFRFFEAVTATFDELALDRTILLVIDDLHAADQPTLLLLRHVLRGTNDGHARRHGDVHRHRGPGRTPAAGHAGGFPGGAPRGDRAPAGIA